MAPREILINSQIALFFDEFYLKPEKLLPEINTKFNIFDAPPTVLPVPNDPSLQDVPILQMSSSSQVYTCNVARSRLDFFHAGSGNQKFSDIEADFIKEVSDLFNLLQENKVKVKRVGFITRFFLEENKQAEKLSQILKKDFTEIFSGEVREVFIKFIIRREVDSFKINDFSTLEKQEVTIVGEPQQKKGILITRDFNTVPEERYVERLNDSVIANFITEGKKKFNLREIKEKLWPTNQ